MFDFFLDCSFNCQVKSNIRFGSATQGLVLRQREQMKTAHDLVLEAKASIQEIPLASADAAISAADLLLDVREADEYAAGHIPGAVHMSRGMIEFKLSGNPQFNSPDLKIVLYCKTSGRAALAANSLQRMGYTHVQSISGGYDGWVSAGKPTVIPALPTFE